MKHVIFIVVVFLILTDTSGASNNVKPGTAQFGFIENKGQIVDQNNTPNKEVLYLFRSGRMHVQLKQTGFSYEVIKTETETNGLEVIPGEIDGKPSPPAGMKLHIHRVDISFTGSSSNVKISALDTFDNYINFYTPGTPEGGVTMVKHYKKILYQNLYPNIDLEFLIRDAAYGGGFKYNIIVKPGGNVNDIKMLFNGANHTGLNENKNIIIETACGNIEESIPYSFQLSPSQFDEPAGKNQTEVLARFIQNEENCFGIKVEKYNPNSILVIDPTGWATYFGDSGQDYSYSVASDQTGNVVITGITNSIYYMATSGAHQSTIGSSYDVFIAKFNTYGFLIWSTYYGGNSLDQGNDIYADSLDNIFVTGTVKSTNGIATPGAYQTTYGGSGTSYGDAFLAKFNAAGTLQFATYFGGDIDDVGNKVRTDRNGNIILAGFTYSINGIASTGAYQNTKGGANDAFLAKFSATGILQWSTYYGGNTDDFATGLGADTLGNIWITGYTNSTNVMASTGALQTTLGGSNDAFMAKFSPAGVRLWGTFYGGSGDDRGNNLCVDKSGFVIIGGQTASSAGISTTGTFRQTYFPGTDAFIVKFSTLGVRQWCSYYGGTGTDIINGIATDYNNNIIFSGHTNSTTAISTANVYQASLGGGNDNFIGKLNPSGTTRIWGTYFGGGSSDYNYGISQDIDGNLFISGYTSSTSGLATSPVHHTTLVGGTYDAFAAKFTSNGNLPVTLISFEARLQSQHIALISWSTAEELNNDYFAIESSSDGIDWNAIGKVQGNGTTHSVSNYAFVDSRVSFMHHSASGGGDPLNLTGTVYYRLRQIDFDGHFDYSKTISVNLNDKADADLNILPNPNNGKFIINASSLIHETEIFDISGKLVFKSSNQNSISVDVELELDNGFYFIRVTTSDGINLKKFIINK